MENNSDKEMRNKLRGIEPPFDPKAWEQMDAMLEKERKPRPLFGWWMGGVAACLILGTGIYGYRQLAKHETANNTVAANASHQKPAKETFISKNKPVADELNYTNTDKKGTAAKIAENQPKTIADAITQTNHGLDGFGIPASDKRILKTRVKADRNIFNPASKNPSPEKTNRIATAKHNNAKLHKDSVGEIHVDPSSAVTLAANNNEAPGNHAPLSENIRSVIQAEDMFMIQASSLAAADEKNDDDMKKKDGGDVDLKKLKKKPLFSYWLGAAANITGTTLGNQHAGSLFYNRPSYMAGITEDYLFMNRIAITDGFMFSQTSFQIYSGESRTTHITELNIPVGLKGYLLSKPKVRFYIGAGIINHIKLTESYTYNINNTNVFTTAVPSTGGQLGVSALSFSGNPNNNVNSPSRYYASFYSTAGTELIIKNRLLFFAEPLFFMSLNKVDVDTKSKYNLGLNGGFRYKF